MNNNSQTTSHLLMIRPVRFDFNAQTAVNNAFQQASNDDNIATRAREEFDAFAKLLQEKGMDVTVVDDTPEPHTPDSVFPNNWVSFHDDGTLVLYPMFAENRRAERKPHVLENIRKKFAVGNKIDLSNWESGNQFLEGTGSMVLDRVNRIAYACLSPRTDRQVLEEFCARLGYKPVSFDATDQHGQPIYHTNVMMCVADRYAVICLDSIKKPNERKTVIDYLTESGKEIIDITPDQVNAFAGNMLQVENKEGKKLLVMSSQAYNSLTEGQKKTLGAFNDIVHSPLETIETNGGGSARCMLAEVFLPAVT